MPLQFFESEYRRRRFISPQYLAFLWFGCITLLGSILLWLPVSRVDSRHISFLDALFTAVSATCVTGLTVVNVAESFSLFGQVVIALLLEMGGLGIMTFALLAFRLFGMRSSFSYQAATADALFQSDAALVFKRSFGQILKVTLTIQLVGAAVLFVSLLTYREAAAGGIVSIAWSAIFHSVSAFCNGGFSVYFNGLDYLKMNIPFLSVLLVLIVLGSLGNTVLLELSRLPRIIRRREKRPRWISLHTRVVLVMTALVIAGGLLGVLCFGAGPGSGLGDDFFLVVSGRTAGFSTVPVRNAPLPTLLIMITMMFIGGSPGSCAGGIKTTSLAIWFARVKTNLRNDGSVNMFGYTIAPDLVSRARILMALTMLWNLLGVFILVVIHPTERLETLIFEQVSAFGTVGLTMDFTWRLETLSRLWIMLSMFVGRLGPLSIALWAVPTVKSKINRPVGRIMVG